MPWEIPITLEDTTYPVRFNTEAEPTQADIDEAVAYLMQQRSAPAAPATDQPGRLGSFASSVGRGALSVVPGTIGGVGYLTGSDTLTEAADTIEGGINRMLPVNPEYQGEFKMKAGQAIGQALSMLGTGGVAGAAGKGLAISRGLEKAAAAAKGVKAAQNVMLGTGVLQGTRGGGQAAEQYGMQGGTAYARALLGGAIEGATERYLFGMGSELSPIGRMLGTGGTPAGAGLLRAVGTEAGEEAVAQVGGNLATTALAPYGIETPGAFAGAGEAALLGGIAGGVFGGVNALMQPSPTIEGEAMVPFEQPPAAEVPVEEEHDTLGIAAFQQEIAQIVQEPDPIVPLQQTVNKAAETSVAANVELLPATAAVIAAGGLKPALVQKETPVGAPVVEQPASGVLLPETTPAPANFNEYELQQIEQANRDAALKALESNSQTAAITVDGNGVTLQMGDRQRHPTQNTSLTATVTDGELTADERKEAKRISQEGSLAETPEERAENKADQRALVRRVFERVYGTVAEQPVVEVPETLDQIRARLRQRISAEERATMEQRLAQAEDEGVLADVFAEERQRATAREDAQRRLRELDAERARLEQEIAAQETPVGALVPEASGVLLPEDAAKAEVRKQPVKAQHITRAKFDTFDPNKSNDSYRAYYGKGFYFHPQGQTTDIEGFDLSNYGDIKMDVELNMEAPWVIKSTRLSQEEKADLFERVKGLGDEKLLNRLDDGYSFDRDMIKWYGPAKFTELLKKNGYDSVIYDAGTRGSEYVVFDAEQINTKPQSSEPTPIVEEAIPPEQPVPAVEETVAPVVPPVKKSKTDAKPLLSRSERRALEAKPKTIEEADARVAEQQAASEFVGELRAEKAQEELRNKKGKFISDNAADIKESTFLNDLLKGGWDKSLDDVQAGRITPQRAATLAQAAAEAGLIDAFTSKRFTPETVPNVENVIDEPGAAEVGLGMEKPQTQNPYRTKVSDTEDFDFLDRLGVTDPPKDAETIPAGPLPEGTFTFRVGPGYNGNPPSRYAITPDGKIYSDSNRTMTHGGASPWVLDYVVRGSRSDTSASTPANPPVQRDVTKPEQMTPEEYSSSERDTELPKNYVLSDGNGNFVTEEKNGWFKVWRLTGTHATLAGTVGFKGVEGLTKAKTRLKEVSAEMHEEKLKDGLRTKRPVSAAAVDAYGITLPAGYVRQGDLYVFQPKETPTSPVAPTPGAGTLSSGQRDTSKPEPLRGVKAIVASLDKNFPDPLGPVTRFVYDRAPRRDTDEPAQMTPEEFSANSSLSPSQEANEAFIKELAKVGKKEANGLITVTEAQLQKAKTKTGAGSVENMDNAAGVVTPLLAGKQYMVQPREGYNQGFHRGELTAATRSQKPVSKAAVDAYGITLPEGYVQDGELYVYRPSGSVEAKPAPPAKPAAQSIADRLRAATSRAEAQEIVDSATHDQLKAAATELNYTPKGTKKEIASRLVASVGSRADAVAIRDAGRPAQPPAPQPKPAAEVETPVAGVPAEPDAFFNPPPLSETVPLPRSEKIKIGPAAQQGFKARVKIAADEVSQIRAGYDGVGRLMEVALERGGVDEAIAFREWLLRQKDLSPEARRALLDFTLPRAQADWLKPKDFGSTNTVVTKETKDKAVKSLRKKIGGQTNVGLDPSILKDAVTVGAFYLEGGVRSFAEFSAKMIEEVGAVIEPYLRTIYDAASRDLEYVAAVESGDMAKAQAMVDEAAGPRIAKRAAILRNIASKSYPNVKLIGENGEFGDDVESVFSESGVYVSGVRKPLFAYVIDGEVVGGVMADADGDFMFDLAVKERFRGGGIGRELISRTIKYFIKNRSRLAAEQGLETSSYDMIGLPTNAAARSLNLSVGMEHSREESSITGEFLDSIDPVTRDEAGQVIPLSQRFDPATPDIRGYGESNVGVTKEKADAAAARMRKKLGQTNVGIDPSILKDAITIGAFHLEAGARSFKDFSTAMIKEFGEGVRKYLRPAYEALRKRTDIDTSGMDPEEGVTNELTTKSTPDKTDTGKTVSDQVSSKPTPRPETPRDDRRTEAPSTVQPADRAEPQTVPIANDPVDAQRVALGLPPIMRQTQDAYTFPQMWADAESAMAANPKRGETLVDELNDKPRTISALEDAILLRERVNRVNALDLAMVEFNNAPKGNNEQQRKAMDTAITSLTELDNALNVAGTEQGRSLNARKMLARQDYTLAKMITTLRAANDGNLSEADVAMVTRLQKQIAEAQAKLAEVESGQAARLAEAEKVAFEAGRQEVIKDIEDRAKADAERLAEMQRRKTEYQAAKKEAAAKPNKWAEIREAARARNAELRSNLYSDVVLVKAASMAVNDVIIGATYIAEGVTKLADWVTSMRGEGYNLSDKEMEQLFNESKAFDAGEELPAAETPLKTRKAKAPTIDKVKAIAADEEALDSRTVYELVVEKMKARAEASQGAKLPEMSEADLTSVIREVTADIQQYFPDISEREVRDLFSGYGKILQPSQDELSKQIRQLSALGKLASAIEDAKAKIAPLKSGPQRDKATQAIRLQQKKLARELRMSGLEYAAGEGQLRSPLDAIKARLNNQINDLALEINQRQKIKKRPSVDYDRETEALVTLRDDLKRISDEVNKPAGPTLEETVAEEMKKLDTRIAKLKDLIAEGQFKPKEDTLLHTAELDAKRDVRDGLNKTLQKMRKEAADKLRTQDDIDKDAIESAQESIDELERKIAAKDVSRPQRRTPTETAEYQALIEKKKSLQQVLAKLRESIEGKRQMSDEQRIKAATKALDASIARMTGMITSGKFDVVKRTPKTPDTPELKAKREARNNLRKRILELRKMKRDAGIDPIAKQISTDKKRIQTRMKKLKERLDKGDFSKPVKKTRATDEELLKLQVAEEELKEQWAKTVFERQLASRGPGEKILDATQQTLNTSRAVLTSFDVSAVLRQAGFIVLGNPLRGLRNLGPMFKAFGDAEFAKGEKFRMQNRENYKNGLYQQAKLFLADTSQVNQMNKQEEAFMTRWLDKLPNGVKGSIIGAGLGFAAGGPVGAALGGALGLKLGSTIRGSQRAYTVFLNRLRMDSFDAMVANLKKGGVPTPQEIAASAKFINTATGRGDLGKFNQAGTLLNTVYFAPRLVWSRFLLLAGHPYFTASGRTKALVLREYAKFLAGAAVVYALGSLAQDDDDEPIELDPRSSDFLKIRFGDTRVDPLSGLIQATVFVSRLASGEKKTAKGKIVPIRGDKVPYGGDTSFDVLANFNRTKFSPIIGSAVNMLEGKNVVGESTDALQELKRMVIPMSFNEAKETLEAQGIPEATALIMLQMFGMGVQTYTPGKK